MKQVLAVTALIILTASCVSKSKHEEAIAKLSSQSDSISAVVANREAEINNFLSDFNEIQLNLDSIKEIEKMVTIKSSDSEMTLSTKNQIINDFSRLHQLLQTNKNLVNDLKKINRSQSQKSNQLLKTITLLEKSLAEKDADIEVLNQKIAALNIDVASLKTSVDELTAESARKSEELLAKEDQINSAWYALGTDKELIANTLAEKTGGFLGLGRSLTVTKNLNKEYFEMVDIREFNSVPLNAKKATLLSVHPEGSFHYEMNGKSVESLVIDDSSKFWSVSKYMVVLVD